MAAGRVMNSGQAGGERHTHKGLTKDALASSPSFVSGEGEQEASDRGLGAVNAATMKAKLAGLTAAQAEEQKAAMFGLFVSEKRALQFCSDYGLVDHLLSRGRIKQIVKELNKEKRVSLGHKTTTEAKKNSTAQVVSAKTTAQKLKSKRMSVLQSLDKSYLTDASVKGGGPNTSSKHNGGHKLFNDDIHRDTFKIDSNSGFSAKDRAARKKVVQNKDSTLSVNGGLSFSEFMEFLCAIALEGMSTEQYHNMFDSPFKKVQALLTVWGVADIKKLEEVLQLHVDIVI